MVFHGKSYVNDSIYTPMKFHTNIQVLIKKFKRTDPPLLNINRLMVDVHSFLVLTKGLNSIQSILQQLAHHGQEQASEWHKLYQLLDTFSTLRRIKTWQRN